ncbi:MAG: RHS repeat-associated core domain-containing protein [Verrucomicrobia bacterium]|nr:RHS repeat-associated core domain-containing protein [Verrucomicrobiota bacterium]
MSIALFQKNKVITESACGNRFLFQGREYDYDTALYYFRNRWYEPETGRWLSPDPIGISGGLNLYTFCGNDPVNFIDPDGLWTFTIGAGIGKFAFKITIGENYGQKSLKINYGIGLGLDITFDPVETEPKELYYNKSDEKGLKGT